MGNLLLLDFGEFPELVDGLALVDHLRDAAHLLLLGQHLGDHGVELLGLQRNAVLGVLGLDGIARLGLDLLPGHVDVVLVDDVVLDDLPLDALGVLLELRLDFLGRDGLLIGDLDPPLQEFLGQGRIELVHDLLDELPAEHAVAVAVEDALQVLLDLGAEAGLVGHDVLAEQFVVQLFAELGRFDVPDLLDGEAGADFEFRGGLGVDPEHVGEVLRVAADLSRLDHHLRLLAQSHEGLGGLGVLHGVHADRALVHHATGLDLVALHLDEFADHEAILADFGPLGHLAVAAAEVANLLINQPRQCGPCGGRTW